MHASRAGNCIARRASADAWDFARDSLAYLIWMERGSVLRSHFLEPLWVGDESTHTSRSRTWRWRPDRPALRKCVCRRQWRNKRLRPFRSAVSQPLGTRLQSPAEHRCHSWRGDSRACRRPCTRPNL